MSSLKAGLKNELLLMLYRRKTMVFLGFSAILPVLLALSLRTLQPLLGLFTISRSFPIDMLGLYTMLWIPLFIFLTAADLFPNEIASKTLKLALLRPISRFHVYLSKTLALLVGIAAMLLLVGVMTLACSLFLGSAGSFNPLEVILTYAAAFLSMSAIAVLFVFVVQFFGSSSGAFTFSIVLYAIAKVAPFFSHAVSAFSPTAYTDWHLLWISNTVSAGRLFSGVFFLISCCILFFSLGYFMFNRKEV
ncbi:ABC transporter permease [Paenibacillus cremeus]|uniref:ABC transporter permease n=1 Tax=Paenibacillus cremeus TaxID=2163881 RepID=A0A559JSS9_9BACL|nr:ABC transporter permease [Paenibacillus cremeus]TVY02925.1 ABC transporter permease [Paenibacillus cremeus]